MTSGEEWKIQEWDYSSRTQSRSTRHLMSALHRTMEMAKSVGKTGYNSAQKYAYITKGDAIEATRDPMLANGLLLFPNIDEVSVEQCITTVRITYELHHAPSGEFKSLTFYGTGKDSMWNSDKTVQLPLDKGLYKAISGATKYMLLELFQLPTDDDPEDDRKPVAPSGPPQFQPRPVAPSLNASVPAVPTHLSILKHAPATPTKFERELATLQSKNNAWSDAVEAAVTRDEINAAWTDHATARNELMATNKPAYDAVMAKCVTKAKAQ